MVIYIISDTCENQNLKSASKLLNFIDYWLFNTILTSGKIQLCTHNQTRDRDISNTNSYCILCSIALMHVKIKI